MTFFLKDTDAMFVSLPINIQKSEQLGIFRSFIPSRCIMSDLKTWSTRSTVEETITNKHQEE